MSLRTEATELQYTKAKMKKTLIPLSQEEEIVGTQSLFHYWKLVANRFPHDLHHTHHIMVVLRRDCPPNDVTLEELEELWYRIVPWADERFDYVKFNLSSVRSVGTTAHLHLLALKPEFK